MKFWDTSFFIEYFHQLRMVKRKEIKILSKAFRDIETMEKLIDTFFVNDNHLCCICSRLYDSVDDYYEYLPVIFNDKEGNIKMVCNEQKCREEFFIKLKNMVVL